MPCFVIARLTTALSDISSAPVASTMSDGVRTALLALLGLLVVIFGCLIAFAFVLRSRPGAAVVETTRRSGESDDDEPAEDGEQTAQAAPAGPVRDPMVCSTCRREFDSHLRYCPHDATRLIPAPQMLIRMSEKKRQSGTICPRCRSAYSGSMRFCPHDGSELLPISVSRTAQLLQPDAGPELDHEFGHDHGHGLGHGHGDDDGEIGKICPECRGRYKYGASFCGKDGVELVMLN